MFDLIDISVEWDAAILTNDTLATLARLADHDPDPGVRSVAAEAWRRIADKIVAEEVNDDD